MNVDKKNSMTNNCCETKCTAVTENTSEHSCRQHRVVWPPALRVHHAALHAGHDPLLLAPGLWTGVANKSFCKQDEVF